MPGISAPYLSPHDEVKLPPDKMRSSNQPADGNKGGWLEGWIKAAGWLNSETRRSSSSLPWALVFFLSSCGLYLHPGVQQSQWNPGGELVSGPGRMEKVPKGSDHLWSYRHAGEINMKQKTFTALSGVSCVLSVWPTGLQTSKRQVLCGSLSCSPGSLDWTSVPISTGCVCGSAEGDFSPNNTQCPERWKTAKRDAPFSCLFFSIIRLTYPPNLLPRADKKKQKKTHSSGALLLTHSPSSTRPLFIPPTSFYIWQRDRSLFSLPLAWLAVTMVSCRHVSVQTRNTGTRSMSFSFFFLHDVCYSISDCLKKNSLNSKEGWRS